MVVNSGEAVGSRSLWLGSWAATPVLARHHEPNLEPFPQTFVPGPSFFPPSSTSIG